MTTHELAEEILGIIAAWEFDPDEALVQVRTACTLALGTGRPSRDSLLERLEAIERRIAARARTRGKDDGTR